jgi:hypothetical protein
MRTGAGAPTLAERKATLREQALSLAEHEAT